jgi:hypothetical protein
MEKFVLKNLVYKNVMLLEDFRSMRKKYIDQGINPESVNVYLDKFRKIKDKYPKDLENPNLELDIPLEDRKNIDKYESFETLEYVVDFISGQRRDLSEPELNDDIDVSMKKSYKIYEDSDIILYRGDNPNACIEIRKEGSDGRFVGWCVAQDSGNRFYDYRLEKYTPTFYFIKQKNETSENPYYFFVLQVTNIPDRFIITNSRNDGDKGVTYNSLVNSFPFIEKIKKYLVPIELTSDEIIIGNLKNITIEQYKNLSYNQKDIYINSGGEMNLNMLKLTSPALIKVFMFKRYRSVFKYNYSIQQVEKAEYILSIKELYKYFLYLYEQMLLQDKKYDGRFTSGTIGTQYVKNDDLFKFFEKYGETILVTLFDKEEFINYFFDKIINQIDTTYKNVIDFLESEGISKFVQHVSLNNMEKFRKKGFFGLELLYEDDIIIGYGIEYTDTDKLILFNKESNSTVIIDNDDYLWEINNMLDKTTTIAYNNILKKYNDPINFDDLKKIGDDYYLIVDEWSDFADYFDNDKSSFVRDILSGDGYKYFDNYESDFDSLISYNLPNENNISNEVKQKTKEIALEKGIITSDEIETISIEEILQRDKEEGDEEIVDVFLRGYDDAKNGANENEAYNSLINSIVNHFNIDKDNIKWVKNEKTDKETLYLKIIKILPEYYVLYHINKNYNSFIQGYTDEEGVIPYSEPYYGFDGDVEDDDFNERVLEKLYNLPIG